MAMYARSRRLKEAPTLRARLRVVTKLAHERLHAHPGFAAAASGAISMEDYRLLLSRLFGYHRAFEIAARRGVRSEQTDIRARSDLIVRDLEALGLSRRAIGQLPLCDVVRAPRNQAERLGGLYVLEGSTLGGIQIARALQSLLPSANGDGRRFFLGYGDRHALMWRSFLDELESLAADPIAASDAANSALSTFDEFERWMSGWKPAHVLGATSGERPQPRNADASTNEA
jgi:heme oxygenase